MQLLIVIPCLIGLVHTFNGRQLPPTDITNCSLCAAESSTGHKSEKWYQIPTKLKPSPVSVDPGPGPELYITHERFNAPCNKRPGEQCTQHTVVHKKCPKCTGFRVIHTCGPAPV
ncbi:hypothetical protein PGT21_004185 [Puccinia graminis f. sp. tritici]|uniref:Secreted protein n=1 Tax=Puccinia graminis f. sp. tritici TaxID=56615 RepID=A0A5B0MC50_PUCGR|nr:hypothetical protein PGT21_004185 [Puccinia graminis f. sp. tritici]